MSDMTESNEREWVDVRPEGTDEEIMARSDALIQASPDYRLDKQREAHETEMREHRSAEAMKEATAELSERISRGE